MNTSVVIAIIVTAIVIVALSPTHKYSERYCPGQLTYVYPPYPTMEHMASNNWLRYDISSDRYPLSPF